MHVGRGEGYIAQAGRTERIAAIGPRVGSGVFGIVGHAENVELVVAEDGAAVALGAAAGHEGVQALHLLGDEGGFVAAHVLVKRGIGGEQRALKCSQRLAHVHGRNGRGLSKGGPKQRAIRPDAAQPRHHRIEGHALGVLVPAHLLQRGYRHYRLRFERVGTVVPEHGSSRGLAAAIGGQAVEGRVEDGGRVALAEREIVGRAKVAGVAQPLAVSDDYREPFDQFFSRRRMLETNIANLRTEFESVEEELRQISSNEQARQQNLLIGNQRIAAANPPAPTAESGQ